MNDVAKLAKEMQSFGNQLHSILVQLEGQQKLYTDIAKKIHSVEDKTGKMEKKLYEHDDQFTELKDDLHNYNDGLMTAMDEQTVIMQRLDQERVFTFEIVKRLQNDVENHAKDLKRIKQLLKIA
jgi:chromosome segregation ATPase